MNFPVMKKILTAPAGFLTILFLMIFLCAGATPDQGSKHGKKSRKTEIRHKKSECNRTPVKEYKKLTGYNKTLNRPQKAGY